MHARERSGAQGSPRPTEPGFGAEPRLRMTFEIEINGRTRAVSIERAGSEGRYRVSVDGEVSLVDAQRTGTFGLSLIFPDAAHDAIKVAIAPGSAQGELLAYLGGRTTPVSINARRTGRGAAGAGGNA